MGIILLKKEYSCPCFYPEYCVRGGVGHKKMKPCRGNAPEGVTESFSWTKKLLRQMVGSCQRKSIRAIAFLQKVEKEVAMGRLIVVCKAVTALVAALTGLLLAVSQLANLVTR